jgi:hypothetical protein
MSGSRRVLAYLAYALLRVERDRPRIPGNPAGGLSASVPQGELRFAFFD